MSKVRSQDNRKTDLESVAGAYRARVRRSKIAFSAAQAELSEARFNCETAANKCQILRANAELRMAQCRQLIAQRSINAEHFSQMQLFEAKQKSDIVAAQNHYEYLQAVVLQKQLEVQVAARALARSEIVENERQTQLRKLTLFLDNFRHESELEESYERRR
jgi:flagella basal body P-ring formation protein FlgA